MKKILDIYPTNTQTPVFTYKTRPIDFISKNEIHIGEKLKHYGYSVYEKYEIFAIDKHDWDAFLKEEEYEECDKSSYFTNKYFAILFTYHKTPYIPFYSFFMGHNTTGHNTKHLFGKILYSYLGGLHLLSNMKKANIVLYSITDKNVVFPENMADIPFLLDFSQTIDLENWSLDFLQEIIRVTKNFSNKCWEIHLLYYLIRNKVIINDTFIYSIANYYVENVGFFAFFSREFCEKWKIKYIDLLKQYINQPIPDVINDLTQYMQYWDSFSLHALYISLFQGFYKVYSSYMTPSIQTFFKKILSLFIVNLSPERKNRMDIDDIAVYVKSYISQTNWKEFPIYDTTYFWDYINNFST